MSHNEAGGSRSYYLWKKKQLGLWTIKKGMSDIQHFHWQHENLRPEESQATPVIIEHLLVNQTTKQNNSSISIRANDNKVGHGSKSLSHTHTISHSNQINHSIRHSHLLRLGLMEYYYRFHD